MGDTEERSPLREDLSQAFDDITAANEESSTEEETVVEISDEVGEETEESGEVSEEVTADEDAEETEESHEEGDDEEIDATPDVEIEPLEHWKKSDRDMFKTIPKEAQEFLLRRDKEFQSSTTRKLMEVSDIKKALDPVRDDLVKHGVSEGDAVRRLVGAHKTLIDNPVEGIRWLMNKYDINPSDILGDGESDSGSSDDAAMREIQDLKKRLKSYEERTQEQQVSATARQIEEFRETHEFFDEVKDEMIGIAQSYTSQGKPAPSLEQMYEKACRLNDSVFEKILQKKNKAEAAKDKKSTAKSKLAANTKIKSTRKSSGASTEKEKKPLRDDLSDNYDKFMQAR